MKITFIIGSLGYGGKERQLYYLIKHLPEEVEKQLIILSDKVKINDIYNHVDDIIKIKRRKKYSCKSLVELYKKVKIFNPVIIHSWDQPSVLIFKPYSFFYKKKQIYGSIRSSGPHYKKLFKRLKHRFFMSITDCSVSNSVAGLKTLAVENHKKTTFIHNGFDLNAFDCVKPKKISDNEKIKICMVGRFYPSKDYDTLVKVAARLNELEVEFYLIGDGPNRKLIEEKVRKYQLNNITFIGNRDDVPALIKCFDIGILLNPLHLAEGISNAIMEYMAAELPVIATKNGGTPELVKNNVNGFLVDSEDVEGIVNAIRLLMQNKPLRKKMGVEGRKIIEQSFSIENMIYKYTEIYNRISNN